MRLYHEQVFNIPKIEVKPATLRKRGEALPTGRYIPPMAPLATHLKRPSPADHLPPIATVIDLTEEMPMKHGEPSSVSP
jgi:hypothetical protein